MSEQTAVYIKLSQETKISDGIPVTIEDIAEVVGPPELQEKVKKVVLGTTDTDAPKIHFSFLEVARAVQEKYPEVVLVDAGPQDALVIIGKAAENPKIPQEVVKVAIVCIILFFGSALALMSFHNDVSLPQTFQQIHRIVTGEEVERPLALILSYTVGIAVGIFVFFNHVGKKKFTDDPTPIQVQFTAYKKQVDDCLIEEMEKSK